jgi:hypothetical protein
VIANMNGRMTISRTAVVRARNSLRSMVKQAECDAGTPRGRFDHNRAGRTRPLRQENRRLREDVEILRETLGTYRHTRTTHLVTLVSATTGMVRVVFASCSAKNG